MAVKIGSKWIGEGHPCFIVAEIGINHNGSLEIAKQLVDAAAIAGVDAVKFQKRTPELCVPSGQRSVMRETPWGYMTYMDYRYRIEFGKNEYDQIDSYCKSKGIVWFASCWDEDSVDFMAQFDPPCYKVPSAGLTDKELLMRMRVKNKSVILSTGMSTMKQIDKAAEILDPENLIILHCVSTYPAKLEELNLKVIQTLKRKFPNIPIGYSGHEVSLAPSVMAAVLGANVIERHITLDHTMWGTDQAASMEPKGFQLLIRDIRTWEAAKGNGVKRVLESEIPIMKKLRRKTDF
ncbi:MAG: N-acetylneuraminate synthase family protein [Parcubacteria group bacterium]|nr:N-acetylneuraminate synthase family protein [Parcubacteria group bacterium]